MNEAFWSSLFCIPKKELYDSARNASFVYPYEAAWDRNADD